MFVFHQLHDLRIIFGCVHVKNMAALIFSSSGLTDAVQNECVPWNTQQAALRRGSELAL
jgi:hypothetical protein